MSIETTVLDFKLSNTFEEYEAHMNAPEQQAMFKEMGVKTFYIGKSLGDPKRATVMFQGPVNTSLGKGEVSGSSPDEGTRGIAWYQCDYHYRTKKLFRNPAVNYCPFINVT